MHYVLSLYHMRLRGIILLVFAGIISIVSCRRDPEILEDVYNPTPYELVLPEGLPEMIIPEDNPLTVEGVELGRKLFYEKKLSGDNTMSCASCHNQANGFTDNGFALSTGIDGIEGTRNSMALINLGYAFNYFWDGRAATLEEQALGPVPNPIEMHQTWPEAMDKLQADPDYPKLFFHAFGTYQIDSLLAAKAIAQFERTLVSGNSPLDKFLRQEIDLPGGNGGLAIYSTELGDCFHCHPADGGLFTDNLYHNNGLDETFLDSGLAAVTKDPNDMGKFKTPTLRNIANTAPYMHDGRFATLEEVVEHYNQGGHASPTIDPLMKHVGTGLNLSADDKKKLVDLLKALSDDDFLNNPAFSDPNN